MRRMTTVALLFAGLVAAAIVAVPAIVSVRLADVNIADRIGAWTGEQVTVHGESSVAFFPSPAVEVNGVVVSGVAGTPDEALLTIPSISASLSIVSLLTGKLDLGTLTLVDPHLRLARSRTGDVQPDASDPGAVFSGLDDLRLDEVVVYNGSISYGKPGAGGENLITGIDVRLAGSDESASHRLSGTFEWRSAVVEVEASLDDPRAVFDASGSKGRIEVAADPARLSPNGDAEQAGTAPGQSTDESRQSLTALIERLGITLVPGSTFGPLGVSGTFRFDESALTISDATLELDGDEADGTFSARIGGSRPALAGSLYFDSLDPDTFSTWDPRASTLELFVVPASTGWLSQADVDLTLSADEVDIGGQKLREASAALIARDGRMTLALSESGVADGVMWGRLTLDTREERLGSRLSVCLDDVSVADVAGLLGAARFPPLLGAEEPLRGTGTLALELAADGNTFEAVAGSISGVVIANIRGGTMGGVDVESTLERLVDGNTVIAGGNAPFIPVTGRTAFNSLTSYLTLDNGVARAGRIRLDGDRYYVALAGGGDLARGEIEAEGIASLFESPEGKDDRNLDPVVRLPFGVGGTLGKPMIVPGIPRVGHGPHMEMETPPTHLDSVRLPRTTSSFVDSLPRGDGRGGLDGAPVEPDDDPSGAHRDAYVPCEAGSAS